MKTAISLPDSLFEQAERMAKSLKISRSQLYSLALKEYLDRYEPDSITRALDEVYASEPSELDPVLLELQLLSLPKEDW